MKTIFMILLATGLSMSDKLDRTYLPPPGSQFSGGSVEDLKTPLDLPKQYFTTGSPQTVFSQGQSGNQDITTDGIYSDRINTPSGYSNNASKLAERPQRIYNIPTTTTSYAFTQTTTFSPIEDTESFGNNLVSGQSTNNNFQPQNSVFGGLSPVQPTLIQPQFIQQPTENSIQHEKIIEDQGIPNENHNALIPSQNNYNRVKTNGSPINGQNNLKASTQGQKLNSYTQNFDGLPEKGSKFNQNMQFLNPKSDESYPNSQLQNQFRNDGTNFIPINSQRYNPGNSRLPSINTPVINEEIFSSLSPNRFPGSSSPTSPVYVGAPNGNTRVAYPKQPENNNQFKKYNKNVNVPVTTQNYGTNMVSSQSTSPASNQFNDIDFATRAPNQFSDESSFSIPAKSGISDLSTYIRFERPQAEADRNAVILNYENKLTPEGFSYSFDTSNGIHADESGTALNGVKAQGSYSYIGDDGKIYSVVYTADENGFLPRGDHLPTSPPIPEAILKVIEQAQKNKEAGIIEDGSYDDNKYGYKKYQGPIDFNRLNNINNAKYNKTTNINKYNQPFKPDVTYSSEVNKEDTIDYIEEDVNAADDNKTPEQYSRIPSRQPGYINQLDKQKDVQEDVTADDQKPTIGIDRIPGLRKPNRKQETINGSQNVGSLDSFVPVTGSRNQQTIIPYTIIPYTYRNQNTYKNNQKQVKTPDNIQISYNTPVNSNIPSRQQVLKAPLQNRPADFYRPLQNKFKTEDDFKTSQENKQQSNNPNRISNSEQFKSIDQNTGYEYVVPMKTFELTQNNRTPYYTLPETTKTLNYGEKSTAKPFVTPILNSSEESEENLSDSNGNLINTDKLVNNAPNPNDGNNIISQPQSSIQSNSQGPQQNLFGTQNSQKEYLPNKYYPFNLQGITTPVSRVSINLVPTPSAASEDITTYRPSTVSVPFDAQTTPIPTSFSPVQQSNIENEKRYPTTTYRPNYFINKDTEISNVNSPSSDLFEQFAGEQINPENTFKNGNRRPVLNNDLIANQENTQSLNLPTTDNSGNSIQVRPNQPISAKVPTQKINYSPASISGQNNPEFIEDRLIVRPKADMNGVSKIEDQKMQNQVFQTPGGNYPSGLVTIAKDKYGRPLIPAGDLSQGNKVLFSGYTAAPNNQAATDTFIPPYQGSMPEYSNQGAQETVIGEDFSGPKQKQKFDPQTGYYYK